MVDRWPTIHAFNRLVREGKAVAIMCPEDEAPLLTRLGKDDEPTLWCPVCKTYFTPGVVTWQSITAILEEWNV